MGISHEQRLEQKGKSSKNKHRINIKERSGLNRINDNNKTEMEMEKILVVQAL